MPYGQQYGYQTPNYYQNFNSQPFNNVIEVSGINGANAFSMGPNGKAILFDANENYFFLKTTDDAGYPTTKRFWYEPRDFEIKQQETASVIELLEKQTAEIKEIKEMFDGLRKDVEELKTNAK